MNAGSEREEEGEGNFETDRVGRFEGGGRAVVLVDEVLGLVAVEMGAACWVICERGGIFEQIGNRGCGEMAGWCGDSSIVVGFGVSW